MRCLSTGAKQGLTVLLGVTLAFQPPNKGGKMYEEHKVIPLFADSILMCKIPKESIKQLH